MPWRTAKSQFNIRIEAFLINTSIPFIDPTFNPYPPTIYLFQIDESEFETFALDQLGAYEDYRHRSDDDDRDRQLNVP
ncbi:hypothetical protein EVAR_30559_1 [Eumeta japonica]|uniref:Uncharacterized protein n=1 Tax=Eumeta variegata TaxID=151549 RepID=A0A4C1VPN5_EUMVA|nr:hypothetical protein EVAR_30559_1 [Eumeta japonica]